MMEQYNLSRGERLEQSMKIIIEDELEQQKNLLLQKSKTVSLSIAEKRK